MAISKVTFGVLGATGVSGGGALIAYQMGAFSKAEKPLSVEQRLKNEEYELISSDEKYKEIFKDLKGKVGFIKELDKYKEINDNLSGDDGTKGGPALKKMCVALLKSTNEGDFKNASEGCVLRIKDKVLTGKSGIPFSDGTDQTSFGKASFTANKNAIVAYGVTGIQAGTTEVDGHPKVKTGCSENTILPINKSRKTMFEKAFDGCTKTP